MATNKAPAYLPNFFTDEEYFYDKDKLALAPPPASPPASTTGEGEKAGGGMVTAAGGDSQRGIYLERDDPQTDNHHHSGPGSSVGLPSHNTRWAVEEDERLREGIAEHGYGKWKTISEHVKTRNPLQCKNRARHWQTTAAAAAAAAVTVSSTSQYHHDGAPDRAPLSPPTISPLHCDDAAAAAIGPSKTSVSNVALDTTTTTMATMTVSPVLGIKSTPKSEETAPAPGAAVVQFDRETISEHEKKGNPEWFTNKATTKTPERYLKIRNHIIDSWQTEFKPEYMTKTAARRGLKDCGDVNAIGRVHAYLESLGAINQGCEPRKPPVVKRSSRRVFYYYGSDDEDHLTSNKRKSRPDDDYNNESIVMNSKGSKARPRRVTKRPQHYYDSEGHDQDDQFCLVPVEDYESNDLVAPFQLEITSNALIVMDFHSHLAHTEVIGLLGGRYLHDKDDSNGQGTLYVETVFPCKGTRSTDIECEMDPESEMKAREDFATKGLSVVGWYHSHPTFEPNPSVRDIEYQNLYQALFRDKVTGIEPFIGVIVNPFDPDNADDTRSRIQYIHIQHQWEGGQKRNVPYACCTKIAPSTQVPDELVNQIKTLVNQFKDYDFKTDMTSRQQVDRMIESLRANLTQVTDENAYLLDVIRSSLDKPAL